MLLTGTLPLLSAVNSCSPISRFVRPSATSREHLRLTPERACCSVFLARCAGLDREAGAADEILELGGDLAGTALLRPPEGCASGRRGSCRVPRRHQRLGQPLLGLQAVEDRAALRERRDRGAPGIGIRYTRHPGPLGLRLEDRLFERTPGETGGDLWSGRLGPRHDVVEPPAGRGHDLVVTVVERELRLLRGEAGVGSNASWA